MDNVLGGKQRPGGLHIRQDDGVGLLGLQPRVLAGVIGVAALVVHRHHHVHPVPLAGLVVVGAEAGSGVDAAGTGVHGDIVRQHQTGGLGQEGVVGQHILKEGPGMGGQNGVALHAADLHHLFHQGLGQDVDLPVGVPHQGIALLRVQGDGQVAGEGPDGGGPDHKGDLALVIPVQLPQVVVEGELHIHRGAGVVLVLDLGLRQSGLVVGAPVDGLEALVDIPPLVHLPKDLHLFRLKGGVHGQVGVFPVSNGAQALEALALDLHIVLGKFVAGRAELRDGHLFAVELVLLDDGGLNGHAVVVPAGNIGGVVAPHGVGADDDVLDGLVQGVAHVEVAVGEGGAVVEGEPGLAGVLLQQLPIDVQLLPVAKHLGLPLGQTRPHGKVGFGQMDGCIVILRHG